MTAPLPVLIERLARERGADLPPDWSGAPLDLAVLGGEDGLAILAGNAGWDLPRRVDGRPRANRFPLLAWTPEEGWLLAEQMEGHARLRVWDGTARSMPYDPDIALFDVTLPEAAVARTHNSAFDVFWKAMWARKDVLIAATVATIVANIITLATSLYSMQIYDRVIPRAGYSTLWVLTIGVLVALFLDFALRTTRALMIERESARIDHDVSEYFFARAQAVRLDARTGGVGTMAAQLRGLEQVRAMMSSGSLFLLADLPFALFFVLVIFGLGGALALVPLVSLPIALGIAWGLARLIRKDTQRAQISGNLKNGLLVESIDAAETIKANRGGWQMLSRWNRLIEEIHASEDPVKRWTSTAGSIFSTLQQIAYVALIAFGAIAVTYGKMTTGGLIACAIIAGRVNGPLVTQLPSLIVQWGYARASLKMLDNILALPMDEDPDVQGLRPSAINGALRLEGVRFAYPGAREGVDLPVLEIREGERVAIIGGIGSGKTTLLRLLAGLYRPQAGRVMIGSLDAAQLAPDVLRQHIGYLAQDYRLVNGTLRENLLLGLSNPGDDAVMKAVQASGLMQLVSGHPRGLDLPIFEGGRGLSGGQRTLVGLTRLLLAKPPVLLLDEPTANLDDAVEGMALGAVAGQLAPNSTLIVVTHKLRLLSLVNRVIVMANGKVVLDGPTGEVVKKLQAPPPRPKVEAQA
ncbi:ATP-binding cassette domain-containing protein [Sphingomonas tabacisoli]|uniref:ATP-binding cassette domain-containing protein n=1 Tax=Sphingomonas tabacisoli TaxID=2249466 RepID=A0ABW4I556_9SPHN